MTEKQAEYKIEGRPSTIFRTVKNKGNPYVMIDRRPIDNPRLSFKAKGILTYLLSRPDGWEVNLIDLAKRSTEGLSAIKSGVKELKEAGHLKYKETRGIGGQFGTVVWEVYEVPQVGNRLTDEPQVGVSSPQVDYPQADKPQVDNHTQVVLSTLNNNDSNINHTRALSKEKTAEANKMVDAILEQDQKSKSSWSGREKMPEPIRDLLDVYVQLTGQKPLKDQIMDWLSTGNDYIEAGIQAIDLQRAYEKSKPDPNGKGGFMVNRPGSLTRTAQMFAGERQRGRSGMKPVDRALAEIREMVNDGR